MGKLTLTTFVTLDGVTQAPGGPEENTSGGFEYGGWVVPFADEGMGQFMKQVFDRCAAFLLGRRTYDIFSAYWPEVTDPDDPIASRLNGLPKHVVSTTLERPQWEHTEVVSGDVATEVARLKERTEDGELQIHGSGALARFLMAHDLIDEYNLLVFPVFLGRGRRLFPDGGPPTAFEPAGGGRTTSSGIVIHTYRPAGRARFGTFAVDG